MTTRRPSIPPGPHRRSVPRRRRRFTLAIWLCRRVAPAQESAPPRLDPVVVESGRLVPDRRRTEEEEREEIQRTPGGVEIVGEQAIRQSRGSNLQDVLQFVPGVLIRSRFGAADESQFSIRGSGLQNNFHQRGVNILTDGFFYGNADGFSDFESLELRATKRIEVYKGANALRFGASSIGGAINLVTKTGYDAGLIEFEGNYGSYGFAKTYLGTGQVYGPFDLYVGLSNTDLQGYRQWSEQTRWRASGTGGYVLPDGTALRLDLGYVKNQEQLPGALTLQEFMQNPRQAQPEFLLQRAERNYDYVRGGFTLWTPLGSTQALEGKVQANYQDLDHPLPFAVIDQNTTNWGVELRYLLTAPLFGWPSRFTAGFQYLSEYQVDQQLQNFEGRRGALILNNRNRASLFGVYAEEQLSVTPTLALVLGGRVDYSPRSVDDLFTDQQQTVELPGGGAEGRLGVAIHSDGSALRQRERGLPAAAAPGGHRSREPDRSPRFAQGHQGLAVRGGDPGDHRAAPQLGSGRVRLRALERDPERQRPAVPGGALHHPALPEHPALASHRCRGRFRRPAPERPGRLPRAREGR